LASSRELVRRIADTVSWEGFAVLIAFVYLAWCFTFPLRTHISVLGVLQDDAYYYLKIAGNVANGNGSTFNGIVPTNGYHPLWLLLLTALCFTTHNLTAQVCVVCFLGFAGCLLTFLLSQRLCLRLGLSAHAALAVALMVLAFSCQLFTEGMEVTLTIPLMIGLLIYFKSLESALNASQAVILGLLASLCILSRLDTAIWLAMVALFGFCDKSIRSRFNAVSILCTWIGLLPVLGYLVFNRVVFQTWTPISGQAKQLKPIGFSFHDFAFFSGTGKKAYVLALGVLVLAMLVWVVRNWSRVSPLTRSVLLPTALFPFTYYGILASTSDWSLWPWYFYPCPVSLLAICAWFLEATTPRKNILRILTGAVSALALFRCLAFQWHPETDIANAALHIQTFVAAHPGRYAMGDRAGAVACAITAPVVQTEGLVMDSRFLENIRQRRKLKDVLLQYGVRYYISSTGNNPKAGYYAQEPFVAGPNSPKMNSYFPGKPSLVFQEDGYYTRIFDLTAKP
jgi:hypothetical protein